MLGTDAAGITLTNMRPLLIHPESLNRVISKHIVTQHVSDVLSFFLCKNEQMCQITTGLESVFCITCYWSDPLTQYVISHYNNICIIRASVLKLHWYLSATILFIRWTNCTIILLLSQHLVDTHKETELHSSPFEVP